jgi:TRAP-type C4-dicarboxylate transport system permease small subunit
MMIKRFMQRMNRIMAGLSGVTLGFIMIFILIDIISRTISKAVLGASELAIFAMIITVYLGLSFCEEKNGHVRVEVFLSHVPLRIRKILNVLSYCFVFAMWGIAAYSVGKYALSAYKNNEAVAGLVPIVIYPVISVMFICCIFYWIQIGLNLLDKIRMLFNND